MKTFLLVYCLVITMPSMTGFNMDYHCSVNQHLSNADFLKHFPYDRYFKEVGFTDFKTLQRHRYLLYQKRTIGDDFLYHLGDQFLKKYPVQSGTRRLNEKITIGEQFIASKKNINTRVNEIYQIIGYFILGKVAQQIEADIKAGNFDISNMTNEQLLNRLANNKVYLAIEKSSFDKLKKAFETGQYWYLWDRVVKKAQEYLGVKQTISTLKLGTYKDYGQVSMFSVKDNSGAIGYCIWLQRPSLKATYYAAGKVPNKFNNFRQAKGPSKIILATTGGFTNSQGQPEGLTVDKGTIVNAVLLPERHGLVIVQNNGGIRVTNIKKPFILPGISYKLDPLNSLLHYSELLHWCSKNKATLFQTQLLAYGDQQLIQLSKAANQLRERRLLALVRDTKDQTLHHVIFHITGAKNLAVITEEVYQMMKVRQKKVEAILNLDVGSFNILQTYDNKGRLLRAIQGPVPISKATNLIIYSR